MPDPSPVSVWRTWAIHVAWGWCSLLLALAPSLAQAAGADLPPAMADGRMLGHLAYAEASQSDLLAAPPGFAIGPACLIHRDAAPDLTRMLAAAARTPGVGTTLHGVSCFRTIAHQRAVFCRKSAPGTCRDPVARARSVGPPGYSEHATGYAIDFGIRPAPGCAYVEACIAATPAGRWLLAHAPDYGFELSFPSGNAQGVTWEPWHWRWVGAKLTELGAARARITFARARSAYPARPGVADASDVWLSIPPPPIPASREPLRLPPVLTPPIRTPSLLAPPIVRPTVAPGAQIKP